MCCRETVMPITATEASRLSRRTGLSEDQFCSKDDSGIRRLLNNQNTKACVFLATSSDLPTAPGICTVYDARPLGCRTYPVILDEQDLAILDDLCPHTQVNLMNQPKMTHFDYSILSRSFSDNQNSA